MPLPLLLCAVLLAGAPPRPVTMAAPAFQVLDTLPAGTARAPFAVLARAVPPVAAAEPAADAWIGEDKARHFLMSFGVTMMGYGVARASGVAEADARVAAAAGSGLAGVGKEIHDLRAGGPFSVRDLAWDAAGIAAGVMLLFNIR